MSTTDNNNTIEIFTDGACAGNPGAGGYGVIVARGSVRQEFSGGFRKTTNNRMELMAAIVGLMEIETPSPVTIFTDSQYVANGITKGWAKKWRSQGWMRTPKDPAINPDLWETLLQLCDRHDVTFQWVRGHAGHPENERCDKLSVAQTQRQDLPSDTIYERNSR